MTQMRIELDQAMAIPHERPIDVHRAHAAILGYERFLRVSGQHLNLLAFLGQTESAAWRALGDRLAHLPTWEVSEGPWSRAALLLGTAHDLVATHVGPDRELRTSEIEDLAGGPELNSTAREMFDRLEAAAASGDDLLDRTKRRQKQTKPHPTTVRHYAPLRSASRAIAVFGRAARWDVREAGDPSPVDPMQRLAAAPLPGSRRSPEFHDSLEALRLLRHLVRGQAQGELPASPISLRDLALLGAMVTNPEELGEPQANASPVSRLEHAHLKDQLDFAHQSWTQLADHLMTHTQGLTKAPREYAVAVDQLRERLDPELRIAIARALPDLGRRAGETIRQLSLHNALVSPRREPGVLQAHWRPVSAAHRESLAELFTDAGAASRAVAFEGAADAAGDEGGEAVRTAPRSLTRGHRRSQPVQQ